MTTLPLCLRGPLFGVALCLVVSAGVVLTPQTAFAQALVLPTDQPADTVPAPTPRTRAFLTNPIPTVVGGLALTAGIPAVALNVRYHRVLDDRWALTLVPEFGYVWLFVPSWVVGIKVGARVDLTKPGLEGWYLTPQVLLGYANTSNNRGKQLAGGGLFGVGAEVGRTWAWGAFMLEVGGGLYLANSVGGDENPLTKALPGARPLLNISLGYTY